MLLFKSIVNGETTTDDGRWIKTDHKSSPYHYVTGELEILFVLSEGLVYLNKQCRPR